MLVPRILEQIAEAIAMIPDKRVSERTRLQPHAVEQTEKTKDDEQQADYAREHVDKLEADLQKVCPIGERRRTEGVLLQDEEQHLPIPCGSATGSIP